MSTSFGTALVVKEDKAAVAIVVSTLFTREVDTLAASLGKRLKKG